MILTYKPTNDPVQPNILFEMFRSQSKVLDLTNDTQLTDDTQRIVNKLLISGIVNVSTKDSKGFTVLSPDYQHQRADVFNVLINYSKMADIDQANRAYYSQCHGNGFFRMLHNCAMAPSLHQQKFPRTY